MGGGGHMGGQWDNASWEGTSPSFVAPQMTLPPPTVYAMAPPMPVVQANTFHGGVRQLPGKPEALAAEAAKAKKEMKEVHRGGRGGAAAAGAAAATADKMNPSAPVRFVGKTRVLKETTPWDVPAPALKVTTSSVKTSGAVVVGVAAETERSLKDMATDEIEMLSLDAAEKLLAVEEEKAAAVKAKRVAAMKATEEAAMRAKEVAAVKAKEAAKGAAVVKGALKKEGGTDKATAAALPSQRGLIPEELLCPISGKVRGRTMNNERMN